MDALIEILIKGTDLSSLGVLVLFGVSFLGSFVTAALGLGGGIEGRHVKPRGIGAARFRLTPSGGASWQVHP